MLSFVRETGRALFLHSQTGVKSLYEASRFGCGDGRLVVLWSIRTAGWITRRRLRFARGLLWFPRRLFSSGRRILQSQRSSLSRRIPCATRRISAGVSRICGTRPIRSAIAVLSSSWTVCDTANGNFTSLGYRRAAYAFQFHAPRALSLPTRGESFSRRTSPSPQSCCLRERGVACMGLGISIPLAKYFQRFG